MNRDFGTCDSFADFAQAQRFVDLDVWRAQHFVNLEVQISWQTQHLANLEVQFS